MITNYFKKRLIKSFDTWAKHYTLEVIPKLNRRGYSYEILASIIIDFFNIPKDSVIVEIGTGTGILGASLKQIRSDIRIIGLDISHKMLQSAQMTNAYEELIQCDAEAIPVSAVQFSFIYTAFMLHSSLNIGKFLSEIKQISNKNCRIAVIDLFRTKKRMPYFSRLAENIHSFRYEYGAPSYYHSVNEFTRTIKEAGFTLLVSKCLDKSSEVAQSSAGGMTHHFFGVKI